MVSKLITALSVAASTLWMPINASGADERPGSDPVVVEINGAALTLGDLERTFPKALFQARTTYYESERKTVDDFIDDYLLRQQARQENLTVAELLQRHVNQSISPDPTEEALRVYYEGVDTTEPYETVRGKIIDAVRERRIAKAKAAYVQSLRRSAKVVIRLAPPRAPIVMSNTPTRGPLDARITLLEYADYECPYCQQMQPALEKLAEDFKGKLAFAYKDFPLPMHANAQKAAEASHCAELQGQYWPYHDLLVTTKQLDISALKSHARSLKLDVKKFDKCLETGEAADAVKAHASEAQALGLQGTPTFFVNGRYVSGTPSYERLHAVIAEELSAAEAMVRSTTASGSTRDR